MYRRFLYFIYCLFKRSGFSHAEYLKKKGCFGQFGQHCFFQPWMIPHDCSQIFIHNNVVVATDVKFICHDVIHHVFREMESKQNGITEKTTEDIFPSYSAPIVIFDNCFIGGGAYLLPGVKIGPNAIVAAGSVVINDVPEGAIVGGNPAKVIGEFEKLRQKRRR